MANGDEEVREYGRRYGQIVARAWADDDYRARFLAEPAMVMRESGIDIPPDVKVKAVENSAHVLYLALPPRPSEEMSDEDLAMVAGGADTLGSAGSIGTAGTLSCPFGTLACIGSAGTAGSIKP